MTVLNSHQTTSKACNLEIIEDNTNNALNIKKNRGIDFDLELISLFTQIEKLKSSSFWIGNEIVDTISDGKQTAIVKAKQIESIPLYSRTLHNGVESLLKNHSIFQNTFVFTRYFFNFLTKYSSFCTHDYRIKMFHENPDE